MDYVILNNADLTALRRERVAALEGEHFRLDLQLIEADYNSEEASIIRARQADLVRRIALHQPVEDSAESQ